MATAIAEMPAAPYPEIDQFKLTPNTTYQQQYCGENISGMGAIDYEGRKQALKGKIREMILQIRQPKKPYKMHRGPWEEMPVSEEARRIQGEREAQGQTGLTDSKDIREVDKRSKDAMIKKAEDQVRLAVKQYMDSINYKQQKDSAKNMGKKTPTQGGKDNTVQGRTDLMITSTAMKPQPKPAIQHADIVDAYMGKQRKKYASCLKRAPSQSTAGLGSGPVRTPSPDIDLGDLGGGSVSSPLPAEDHGFPSDVTAPSPALAGPPADTGRPLSKSIQTPQETHWSVWQQRGTPKPSSTPAPPASARGLTPRLRTPASRGGVPATPRPASRSFSRASAHPPGQTPTPVIPYCTPPPKALGPTATEVFGTPEPGPNFPPNTQEIDERALGPKVLTNVNFRSYHDSKYRESPVPVEMFQPRDGMAASHARSLRVRTTSPTRQLGQLPRRSTKSAAPMYEHPINQERRMINNTFKSLQQEHGSVPHLMPSAPEFYGLGQSMFPGQDWRDPEAGNYNWTTPIGYDYRGNSGGYSRPGYSTGYGIGYSRFESAMGPGYHSGYDESPMAGKYFRPAGGNGDYMHPGSHFQSTTAPVRGHFTIHPDWVSERKSGRLNLSHFTSSKDPNRFRYGSK